MTHQLIILKGSPISVVDVDFNLTEEENKNILNLNYREKSFGNPLLSENINIFEDKIFTRIEDTMLNYVEQYKNDILQINNKIRLVSSWVSINNKDKIVAHAHKNSLISCCFYVESTGLNNIIFYVNKSVLQGCHYLDYEIKKYNFFNSENWKIPTIKGRIIIFLSDLIHESINEGNKIMIGSNYFVDGKIGSSKNFTYLEL
jgi:hypothetical protein